MASNFFPETYKQEQRERHFQEMKGKEVIAKDLTTRQTVFHVSVIKKKSKTLKKCRDHLHRDLPEESMINELHVHWEWLGSFGKRRVRTVTTETLTLGPCLGKVQVLLCLPSMLAWLSEMQPGDQTRDQQDWDVFYVSTACVWPANS